MDHYQHLEQVLKELWPRAKEEAEQLNAKLKEKGFGALSRRFNNEVRDALDHLYRIANADSDGERAKNASSIEEHLRRGTVESREFLVEEQLAKIRPIPLHWDEETLKSLYQHDRKALFGAVMRRLLFVWPRYDEEVLTLILKGQQCLASARQLKGGNSKDTLSQLNEAMEFFERAESHLYKDRLNLRFYDLLLAVIFLAVGILSSVLLLSPSP